MRSLLSIALILVTAPAFADAVTYQWTIGSKAVVMEFSEPPDATNADLFARYFYVDQGFDIPLHNAPGQLISDLGASLRQRRRTIFRHSPTRTPVYRARLGGCMARLAPNAGKPALQRLPLRFAALGGITAPRTRFIAPQLGFRSLGDRTRRTSAGRSDTEPAPGWPALAQDRAPGRRSARSIGSRVGAAHLD